MNRIDLRYMQETEEYLLQQVKTLKFLREELLQAEGKIKGMSYIDGTKRTFEKSRKALDENIRVLNSMAAALRKVAAEYRRTDERIADRYNLDTVIYPETRFETSRITGMEEYQSLMPF